MPPSTIPNRRPRNRSQRQIEESAENKASIVRAATTVFAERGYTQTTLDMVASLVGLSRQGVLHHFASKEALFHAVLEQERRWAEGQLSPGPVTPSTGWAAIRELAGFLGQSPDARVPLQLLHVLEGEGISGNEAAHAYALERTELVRQNIRARLERLRSDGEIAADADLDAAAVLVAATINGLQKRWLIDPGERTLRSFDLLVDLLATQLAPRS